RVGRHAALVERQGRAQRHFLLRHQPVARGDAAAAALGPMCIWEGAADWYRDMTHHGGIVCTFWENWYDMQVKTVQYGAGERGKRSRVHGELVCGPHTLSEAELIKKRGALGDDIRAHPLDDAYHRARSPVWSKVKTPFLSAANWGGQPLHPRGNFEG